MQQVFSVSIQVHQKQSKAMIKRYYKKGESVFRVGEPSIAVFLLISGEVSLFSQQTYQNPICI